LYRAYIGFAKVHAKALAGFDHFPFGLCGAGEFPTLMAGSVFTGTTTFLVLYDVVQVLCFVLNC